MFLKAKRLMAFAVVSVMFSFMLVGCVASNSVVGTWNLTEGQIGDTALDNSSIEYLKSQDMECLLVFNSDGTYTIDVFGEETSGSWESRGSSEVVLDGEETLSLSSSALRWQDGGDFLVFEKGAGSSTGLISVLLLLWGVLFTVQLFLGYGTAYRLAKRKGDNGVSLCAWMALLGFAAMVPGLGFYLWKKGRVSGLPGNEDTFSVE